jgi:hypothetical protein
MDHIKIIASATRQFAEHQTWTDEMDVLLGDFQGNVIASSSVYPRAVKWHNLPGEIHEQGIAILSSDSNILYQENAAYASNPPRITIGKPPRSDKNAPYFVKGGSTSLEGVSNQGNISQLEQQILSVANPHIYNIFDWRVRPTDTPGTSVFVEAGMYETVAAPGAKVKWPGGALDLSTEISAIASGKHQLAVVYFDRNTEALGVSTTAEVTAVGSLPSRSELDDISSVVLSSGQDAKGVAYLYYAQSAISQTYIKSTLDPRWSGGDSSSAAVLPVNVTVRVVTAAGAVTVTTSDYVVIINKTSGASTVVNLPASPAAGDVYIIKDGKGDATTNNITLTPAAGNIDGAGTFVMATNYQSITLVYNGTEWNVV